MVAVTAQEAYNKIVAHIKQQELPPTDWYCGVTENLANRLFRDHKVPEENHARVAYECADSASAREVERALLEFGCAGGTGGGDDDAVFAYAYHITSITSP